MKKQIVIIHGGDSFETYEQYLLYLNNKVLDFERLKRKNWQGTLGEKLGEGFEVLCPKMPNPTNARYLEWQIWFEKLIPFLEDEVVLVGGSLGGIFLAKYLSENDFPKKLRATFLVAAPYNIEGAEYSLVDFTLSAPLKRFQEQGGAISLYHSENDPVVPFSNLAKYRKELPNAAVRIFKDREHFQQAELPEIVEDMRALYEA